MLMFKALHIISMFAAVTLLVGEALFVALAIRQRDITALAAIRRLVGRRPVVGSLFFLIGIGSGLLTAFTGGFNLLAGWLIAAYVLVVAVFVVNGLPFVQRVLQLSDEAIEAQEGRHPTEEVIGNMARSRAGLAAAVNVGLFAAIIADMVLKPF
jgi:uncharacterized membrane protein